MRGALGSAAGFGSYVITHSDVDRWIGTIGGLAGLVLALMMITERVRQWCRRRRAARRLAVRVVVGVLGACLVVGCAGRQPAGPVRAALPVSKAQVLAVQSRGRVAQVEARVAEAQVALGRVVEVAASNQRPALEQVGLALSQSRSLLRTELEENIILVGSLDAAQDELSRVLLDVQKTERALELAQQRARAYWRLKLWLCALGAGVAAWVGLRLLPIWAGPYRWWGGAGAGAAVFTVLMLFL